MIYNKYGVKKKQEQLTSKTQRYERKLLVAAFKVILAAFVFCIVILAGAGFGMLKGILDDAPDASKINIKPKGFKTTIVDQNGKEVTSLSTSNSNRVYVYYNDIPQDMINAFVAIEDERFWNHNGIDMRGIFRALVKDVSTGNFDEGASTITQQLIKNQVFNVGMDETTKLDKIKRKVQEQYLAIGLEKKYTKKQILEYYLNTIYLGQGCNGVEAAAQRYFNKSIKDLTLSEIATIAGITKNPYQFDPTEFPKDNSYRREDVLDKMLELKYIDKAQYDEAMNDDVYARIQQVKQTNEENFSYNSYYIDALMDALAKEFMESGMSEEEAYNEIYTGGYTIYSVQDANIQKIVDETINDPQYYPETSQVALNYTLSLLDKDGKTTLNYDENTMQTYYRGKTENSTYNNIYPSEAEARAAANTYKEEMMESTGATFIQEKFSVAIQPQASFTIMDQKTGYIKAISGGRGEKTGNLTWNRATDSKRQPGSTFKVLAAFLPFIDTGGSLGSGFLDAPYKYQNGGDVFNWYHGYRGWNTVRSAVRDSMNIIAVQCITKADPKVAYKYLLKEGFTTLVKREVDTNGDIISDIHQATALGGLSYGVTNLEITAAYASIANMGTYVKPVYYSKVLDHDGNVVIDNTSPQKNSHEVCRETTAYQLIDAMKDVVTSGTGTAARMKTGIKCAGKTGTTSNSYDLWFCGMTPYYTASVWFGYDSNIEVNTNNHKVMWRDIMDKVAELENQSPDADWEVPADLTKVTLCSQTGLLPGPGCSTSTDWCDKDFIPKDTCKGHNNTITICLDSHKKATDTCPNTQVFTFETDEEGHKVLTGADFEYDESIFSTPCPLHPASDGQIAIDTSAGQGGTISNSVKVKEHDTVTVYITPGNGYTIQDVVVDGQSVGPVKEYTFSDVSGPHSIAASFSGAATEAPTQAPTTQAPTTQAPTETPSQEPNTPAPTEAPTQDEGPDVQIGG